MAYQSFLRNIMPYYIMREQKFSFKRNAFKLHNLPLNVQQFGHPDSSVYTQLKFNHFFQKCIFSDHKNFI